MSSAPAAVDRLPLARIFFVGAVVPALIAGLDHALLSRLGANSHGGLFTVLVLAVYVTQVGLIGVLCGQLEMPVLRWMILSGAGS